MMHLKGCKMIVMAITLLIGHKVIVVTVGMRPVSLRLARKKGVYRG
jgi:tetrahydromethanopterin S-methyltransferase subunit D